MCYPKFARRMNSTFPPTEPSGDPEIARLRLMFLNLSENHELPLAPFYRWFVLHSIHKRNFKNGSFKFTIPWIPSGPDAWKIENILLTLCSSSQVTDEERATICAFLIEYHEQLQAEEKNPSGGLMTNSAWEQVKRMFDQNDPNHIAGKLCFNEGRHDKWLSTSSSHVGYVREKHQYDYSSSSSSSYEEERGSGLRTEVMQSLEKKYKEHMAHMDHRRGTKRVVSGSAIRSSSPTKKNKSICVQEVSVDEVDTISCDSGMALDF